MADVLNRGAMLKLSYDPTRTEDGRTRKATPEVAAKVKTDTGMDTTKTATVPKGVVAATLPADRVTTRKAETAMAEIRKPAAQKLKEAQALYDAYVRSDEYKQNLNQAAKEQTDSWMLAAITGNADPARPVGDKKEQELKALIDHYTAQVQQEESQAVTDANLKELEGWDEADRAALDRYIMQRDQEYYNNLNPMTDSSFGQTAMLGASELIQKYGLDKVNEMAESLTRSRNAETAQQVTEAAQEGVNDGFWSAVGHNAASVPAKAVGGLTGLMSYIQELGQRTGQYEALDPNSIGNLPSVYGGAVQSQTAQNIEDGVGGVGGKVLSLGYQGVMSMADNYARVVLGGGAVGGAMLAATNTFAQTMSEASAQGATPGQAAILATTNAAIEALSEEIPLDNLMEAAKTGGQGVKQIIKNALIQAGVEATTEEISLFGSVLAEAAVLQEKSSYRQTVAELVAGGMTPEAARQQATNDLLMEAANTFAVSAISGGLSEAGASIAGNLTHRAANPAADMQQERENAAEMAAPGEAEQRAVEGAGSYKGDSEQERTEQAMEETAAQWGQEVPKAEPVQKTEQELTLEKAMAETFGNGQNQDAAPTEAEAETARQERFGSLEDIDAPAEREAPYPGNDSSSAVADPFRKRDWDEVGSRSVKAYMYENPEVKPFFQVEAQNMLMELADTTRGERGFNEDVHYESGGEAGWYGVKRNTSEGIAELLDSGISYDQIEKGLKAIIEDNGAENNAVSKRIEFILNDRLMNGHKDFYSNDRVQPSEEYIKLLDEKQITEYSKESFDALMRDADNYAPLAQDTDGRTRQGEDLGLPLESEQLDGVDRQGIKKDMDEESRYRILAKKNIHVIEDTGSPSHGEDIRNIEALPAKAKSKVEKIIRPLAEKLGILNRNLQSPEISIDFQLSKGKGLKESLSKQLRYGGSYSDFAKALTNLDPILQNAVLIEQHGDKYKGTVREDSRLESVSVLFGAFRDGGSIIPVQMEIKKTSHKGGQLYVTVAMTKVEASVLGSMLDNSQGNSLIPASDYSLSELFSKINPADKHFLKYVPDGFLSEDQLSAKRVALAEDASRIAGYARKEDIGIKGTGAAEQNFTGTAAYEDLLSDDNVQRERKGAARSDEAPKYDSQGRAVSEFVGNSMSSRITPDSFTTTIKQMVADGWASHDVKSNDQSLREAAQAITDSGSVYDALQEVKKVADQGRTSSKDVAIAELIYNHLVNQEGEQEQRMAADAWVTLSQLATNSGRATQIFSVFQRMTPDSQCMVLEKEVKLFAEKMKGKGHVPKDYTTSVAPELMKDYRKAAEEVKKAKTADTKQEAMEQLAFIQDSIYQAEAAKMPATFKAKWDAWRYMCMLGNAKTQVRNVGGNLAFKPYKEVKDTIGAGLERIALDKSKRTKAVLTLSEEDQRLRAWAKADRKSEAVQNALKYSAKLGDDVSGDLLKENVQVFNTKGLEAARKLIEKIPGEADLFFKNGYYDRSLAGFLKARGYSAADLQAGRVNEAVLNEGRAYAIDEAMKATFNDCNAFSDCIASIGRDPTKKDNAWKKALNVLGEGVLPFRRTPANIVVRFTEYSPVGLVKGVWNAGRSIVKGDVSAATAIDQMAAGLTGTGAMALGVLLAKGIGGVKLTSSGGDEDEERQGHQDYALEFSMGGQEYSYTIDWAAPANLTLFVGANLYNLMSGGGEEDVEVSKFTSFIYSMGTMFEPMLSLSCLSSLNDLFEAGKYSDGDAIYSVAAQLATSYLTQGIPTLARQTVQAFQENKQTTFANSSDPLVRDLQWSAAGTGVVPALKTDAVNAWGETESQGNAFMRVFNSFINPGTLKKIDNSELEQEVTRLNESQPDSVSPPDTPKSISYTDANGERHTSYRLTEEEYNTLATVQGQMAKTILEEIISNDTYAAMTDEQKASVFEYVYDYAREKGRSEALDSYDGLDGWMAGIEGSEADAILDKAVKNAFADAFDQLEADPAAAAAALDQAYSLVGEKGPDQVNFANTAGGRVKYFIEARRSGVNAETFVGLYQQFREIDQNPDYKTSDKAAEWAYQLEKAQEAGTITKAQKDAMKDSMVYYQMFPAETVKFDQLTESGISADKAMDIGQLMEGITPQEGYTNVRDVQKAAALAGSNLSRSEKTSAMKIYLSNAQDENLDLMLGLGYGPEEYAAVYEIYSDESGKGKKARTINKIREELGVDYSTAKQIYDIYG